MIARGADDTWTVRNECVSGVAVCTSRASKRGCASPSAINLRTLLSTKIRDVRLAVIPKAESAVWYGLASSAHATKCAGLESGMGRWLARVASNLGVRMVTLGSTLLLASCSAVMISKRGRSERNQSVFEKLA